MKKVLILLVMTLAMFGCNTDDATIANHNMNKAADNFEIMRRVVFYNSFTDSVVLVTEGRCSVSPGRLRTSVTCKVGNGEYVRNFYGKSDNTVYFVEQMDAIPVNVYHYRRTFKPQTMLPDVDFRGSGEAMVQAVTPDRQD